MKIGKDVPGSFFERNGRWFWKVKLPGESDFKQYPMIPRGGQYATTDKAVAIQVARMMLEAARIRTAGTFAGWDGTVGSLANLYLDHAKVYYRRKDGSLTSQVSNVADALKPLMAEPWARMKAEDFGPLALQDVRQTWITKKLCRSTINDRVRIIIQAFTWATSKELVPGYIAVNLSTVESLHKNRSEATEPTKVKPVHPDVVKLTKEHMPDTVSAMVDIHMLTGMRSTELCCMKPCYIDRTTNPDVWIYNVPDEANKNAHREGDEHKRHVPLTGKVKDILAPFLLRSASEYCFKPQEAETQRRSDKRAARKSRLDKSGQPYRRYDDHGTKGQVFQPRYDNDSYRKAITWAVKRANRDSLLRIKEELGVDATSEEIAKAFERVRLPMWHPHQLRHTAATMVRKALGDAGLDAARALLGQKTLEVADRYAEIDMALAIEAAKRISA